MKIAWPSGTRTVLLCLLCRSHRTQGLLVHGVVVDGLELGVAVGFDSPEVLSKRRAMTEKRWPNVGGEPTAT